MANFIKENTKMLFQTLIIILITSVISVSATSKMNSNSIVYLNSDKVASVQDALDTLYDSIDVATITPVGSILPYMGISAPENYLICDGSTYNISEYQKLADHIKADFGSYNYFGGDGETTFAVPDLRGEFLRGAGTNSHANQGSGASVGEHQDGTELLNQLYTAHNGGQFRGVSANGSVTRSDINDDSKYGDLSSFINQSSATNGYNNGNSYTKLTSRPTNTSVNYIIKVK